MATRQVPALWEFHGAAGGPRMNLEGEYRLEVNLRGLYPHNVHDRQEAILDRLRRLEGEGVVREIIVNVWGRRIPVDPRPDTDGPAAHLCELFAAYERWAERTGRDLSPAFERKSSREETEHVVVPQISIAIYDGGEVCGVFPCRDDDAVFTVEDMIEMLASRDVDVSDPRPTGDAIPTK